MLLLSNALRNSEDKQDRTIIKGQQDSSKSAAHSLMALETQYHHVLAISLKKHFSTEESEILTHTRALLQMSGMDIKATALLTGVHHKI